MADFGGGPYAWIDGECVGDRNGFEPEYNVSQTLQIDFSEWINKLTIAYIQKNLIGTLFIHKV